MKKQRNRSKKFWSQLNNKIKNVSDRKLYWLRSGDFWLVTVTGADWCPDENHYEPYEVEFWIDRSGNCGVTIEIA